MLTVFENPIISQLDFEIPNTVWVLHIPSRKTYAYVDVTIYASVLGVEEGSRWLVSFSNESLAESAKERFHLSGTSKSIDVHVIEVPFEQARKIAKEEYAKCSGVLLEKSESRYQTIYVR